MELNSLSLLLGVSAVFGIFARFFKQPILIGFLFAGMFLASTGMLSDHKSFEMLGKIGVALLLFLVGIEMNARDIAGVGKAALSTGLGQIIFTAAFGFLIASALGFNTLPAIYIAIALTFSSTIIIVKLLSEKKDLGSLYGKISVGFLLVQDFVAVLLLVILAGLKDNNLSYFSVLLTLLKSCLLIFVIWQLSKKILPTIFAKIVGQSQELLFIISIAWALGMASFVEGPLGFSFEIGGFLAGLALSNLPQHFGIASKTRSLRDFFLTLFFVSLGSQLVVWDAFNLLPKAILLSLFVLIGNPLIVMTIMGLLGHKSRTSFLASVTVAQISEFSFILMAMGRSLGHLDDSALTLIILVGAITMTASTYLIMESERIYKYLKNLLKIFERRTTNESVFEKEIDIKNHVVLIGADKIGRLLLPYFLKREIPIVVVDFNPSVFISLTSENINTILGDILDTEIQEKVKLADSKMIICTVPNLEENLSVLSSIKNHSPRPIFIGSSEDRESSLRLYEAGADYVLNPDIVAGEFLRHIFLTHGLSRKRITKMGRSNFNRLMYIKTHAKT